MAKMRYVTLEWPLNYHYVSNCQLSFVMVDMEHASNLIFWYNPCTYPCVTKLFYGCLFIIKCNTSLFSKYFSLFNSSFHVHHHAQHKIKSLHLPIKLSQRTNQFENNSNFFVILFSIDISKM